MRSLINSRLGLQRGTVTVVEYDAAWREEFEAEKNRLLRSLSGIVDEIEHIGSTAVPGLASKPIIDMIAAVHELKAYTLVVKPLETMGYEFMPERVFADRVFFPKGTHECRTHHLSLVVKNSSGWLEPIRLREYLRNNASERERYQELKLKLAAVYPYERAQYTDAKSEIIGQLQAKANLI
jgi:GrpB-like predicted nucleotidyltransferase (UPF0157 family)